MTPLREAIERDVSFYATAVADGQADLADLVAIERHASACVTEAVLNLRAEGTSWTVIGRAVGTSRQAARARWRKYSESAPLSQSA